jgi:hypothetical protein
MASSKGKTKKTRQRETDVVLLKYQISKSDDKDVIIEVPAHWKVTFSTVNPNGGHGSFDRSGGFCVRVYEGEKLRMVEGNATGLRDLSIPLAEKHTKRSGESSWEKDSDGNFQDANKVLVESTWVDKDEDDVPF